MTGGLDALENIGKKTIEVLTEGDPGEHYIECIYCFSLNDLMYRFSKEEKVFERGSSFIISGK